MTAPSLISWVPFKKRGDERGSLVAIEGERDVPFAIARAYYVFGTLPGVTRGFHAHKQLQQVAVCVIGSCTMLMDDGRRKESVRLDSPDRGLLIPPRVWHEMSDFSPDCVLLVLASDHYDEADYLRDYAGFLSHVSAS